MNIERETAGPVPYAIGMIGILCFVTGISQFLRNSIAVIAPDLAVDIGLSPSEIGFLSSAFFFVFALVQIPVGIAIDRFGARISILVCAAATVLGCLMFATATSSAMLSLARIVMGLGCASFFMAPLVIYTRWYRPEQFSFLAGIQQGIGTIGTLVATAPLAFMANWLGWRSSFVLIAVMTGIMTLAVWIAVRDDPPGRAHVEKKRESWAESFSGVADVVRVPGFWPVMAIHLAGYATFASIAGLWLGPYLRDVYGLSLIERGNVLLLGASAHVVGLLIWGAAYRFFGSYRTPVVLGLGIGLAAIAFIVAFPRMPMPLFLIWLFVFCFVISCQPLFIAHGRNLFPPHLIGRGMTMLNMGTMGGVFIMQSISGLVINQFAEVMQDGVAVRDAAAYAAAFLASGLWLAAGIAAYRFGHAPEHGAAR